MKLRNTTLALSNPKELTHLNSIFISLQLYSLVTVDGVGVLVMGLLVTVHAVAGIVAVVVAAAAAAEKEAASLKEILLGSPILCNKYGVICTVYASPGCTPYSVTLVL